MQSSRQVEKLSERGEDVQVYSVHFQNATCVDHAHQPMNYRIHEWKRNEKHLPQHHSLLPEHQRISVHTDEEEPPDKDHNWWTRTQTEKTIEKQIARLHHTTTNITVRFKRLWKRISPNTTPCYYYKSNNWFRVESLHTCRFVFYWSLVRSPSREICRVH